jgi:hypothetical protein
MPYYPLNKITTNLFTSGDEYVLSTTNKSYKGYYCSTYDGKYYTNKTVTPDSIELIKISSTKNPTLSLATMAYDNLIPLKTNTPVTPVQYTSVPTQQDYKNGYYYRYFSKRVNGDLSTITEIGKDNYDALASNPLYNTVQIQWMLTGPLEDQHMSGMLVLGVINRNLKSINQASRQMLYLNQYLTNPTQYYKK